MAGTAIAIFSYIGFDGISTLAEEVENPRVNIGRATILVALFIAIINITLTGMSGYEIAEKITKLTGGKTKNIAMLSWQCLNLAYLIFW